MIKVIKSKILLNLWSPTTTIFPLKPLNVISFDFGMTFNVSLTCLYLHFIPIIVDLTCDFEDFASCSWYNSADNINNNWRINSGKTPTSKTGPKEDYPSGMCKIYISSFVILFPNFTREEQKKVVIDKKSKCSILAVPLMVILFFIANNSLLQACKVK